MPWQSEVLPNSQCGIVMALLDNGVPVAAESLLSSLTSLPTVLWLVRAHSVPLGTGPDVEDVGGCADSVPLRTSPDVEDVGGFADPVPLSTSPDVEDVGGCAESNRN